MSLLTVKLDLDKSAFTEDHTDFPVNVSNLSTGSGIANQIMSLDPDGDDIWFSSDFFGNSPINSKCVYASGDNFVCDVKVDTSSSFNTVVYLQVGDKPVGYSDPYSSSIVGYYHLFDNFNDATSNSNDLSSVGSIVAGETVGNDGSSPATKIDSSSEYLTGTFSDLANKGQLSVSTWAYLTTETADSWLFTINQNSGNDRLLLWADDSASGGETDTFAFNLGDTSSPFNNRVNAPSSSRSINNWHHVVGVASGSSRKIYIDGTLAAEGSSATSTAGINHSDGRVFDWDSSTTSPHRQNRLMLLDEAASSGWIYSQNQLQGSGSSQYWSAEVITASGHSGYLNFFIESPSNSASKSFDLYSESVSGVQQSLASSDWYSASQLGQPSGDLNFFMQVPDTYPVDNYVNAYIEYKTPFASTNLDFFTVSKEASSVEVLSYCDLSLEEIQTMTNDALSNMDFCGESFGDPVPQGQSGYVNFFMKRPPLAEKESDFFIAGSEGQQSKSFDLYTFGIEGSVSGDFDFISPSQGDYTEQLEFFSRGWVR